MSFTAWRITKRKHARTAFSGEGARRFGGRWNSPGIPLIYTSQSQSLAVLELLVHFEAAQLMNEYVLISVEIEDAFVTQIQSEGLPHDWRSYPAPAGLQMAGDEWVRSRTSAVLEVPSTLVPAESNFLLNPAHSDFGKLIIGKPVAFGLDSALRNERNRQLSVI